MTLQRAEKLAGSESQIEWAEGIRSRIDEEFDRVASALQGAAEKQQGQDRLDTLSIIGILEEKRKEVLAIDQAGYFIRVWQDLKDQVRQLIHKDPRYQAIRASRQLVGESPLSGLDASHAI
jgi:hypothetical protein